MLRRACLVVFVLVLLTIMGLLPPWIIKAREQGQLAHCHNNLRHLTLAIRTYHDVHHYLPIGNIPNPNIPREKRLSWLVSVAPFTRSGAPKLNESAPWDGVENRVVIAKGMDAPSWIVGDWVLLLCPANSNRLDPKLPGISHYVGVAGLGEDAARLPITNLRCGVFGYDRKITLRDIADGESTTMMIAETTRNNGPWTAGGATNVRGLVQNGTPYLGETGQLGSNHPYRSAFFGYSYPLATNIGFVDGSVRAFTSETSPQLLEALATIAGGEPVGWPDCE